MKNIKGVNITKYSLFDLIHRKINKKILYFCEMLGRKYILFFLMFGFTLVFSQKKSDFDFMLENGVLKMYQNPESAIKIFKNINSKNNNDQEFLVQYFLNQTYLMKGDYLSAVSTFSDFVKQEKSTENGLQDIQTIELFQQLNLWKQAGDLLSKYRSLKNQSGINNDEQVYFNAKLKALQAHQYNHLNDFLNAQKLINESNRGILGSHSVLNQILKIQNLFLESDVALQTKDDQKLNSCIKEIENALKNNPDFPYFASRLKLLKSQSKTLEDPESVKILQTAQADIKDLGFRVLDVELNEQLLLIALQQKNNVLYKKIQKELQLSQSNREENKDQAKRNLLDTDFWIKDQQLNAQQNKNDQTNLVLGSVCTLVVFLFLVLSFLEFQKGKSLDKQLSFARINKELSNNQLESAEQKLTVKEDQQKKTLMIPKETENDILKKLADFEANSSFTDPSVSLAALAGQFGTNTKYLSEIINKFKGKSFTSYINELRINYIAKLISSDAKYHQYKISYLAELAGFTNHSTFSVVFKSVTGLTPNKFIQQFSKDGE